MGQTAAFTFSLSALLFSRWPLPSGVAAPPGPTSPAYGSLHVAGFEDTGCHELLESGRVCLVGDGRGPRAADVQAQDTT